ncbi:uncharacterized protein LOC112164107 [Rosa chinensis]|uniref:uncharacterized protein LOC112164107 n=1 Tax=Rosa chinensis TaxID=74649 RepID=UPI000D0882D8|nr:uncharacterized protein LOC112164107 [Rosa chinensis]
MWELEERLLRVEAGTPPLAQNPLFVARPGPFTARILQTVRPTYAKTPKIAQFGGSTDLFVHMDTFKKGNYQDKRQKDQHYHNKGNKSFHNDRRDNRDNRHNKPAISAKKFEVLAVLTASYEEIYDQCKDQIQLPPPRKYPKVGKPRNTGKWCKHHEDSGHNTNDCNALKTAIESLYGDGKLEQFKVRQLPPVVTNIEPMRRINTIDGGAFIGSLSHRARKRFERANHPKEVFNIRYDRSAKMAKTGWEPITFSKEEERGIHSPHNDLFLIDAVLDKSSVGRVLVDSGLAVNVIFNGYYKQLQRNNKLLQDHEPLLSFSGDVTQRMGSDYMRLSVGTIPCTAEIHTEFIVVDCFSSYKAIIGRPTLKKLKCIIAGYMLLMKFPTPNGTGSVRGSQSIA